MRNNLAKERIRNGQPAVGLGFGFASAALVELAALAGFHFVFIDCEHGAMSVETVENLVRAAEAAGITPIARVPNQDPQTILRFLDAGVMGIVVPHIDTAEQARRAVASMKYPPLGERGLAGVRIASYGSGMPMAEYVKWANEQTMVIPLIESKTAVENIDEIVKVDGVDVLMIGPMDLSMSVVQRPDPSDPAVVAAIEKVVSAAQGAGKASAMGGIRKPEAFQKAIARRQLLVTLQARDLIVDGGRSFMKNLGIQ